MSYAPPVARHRFLLAAVVACTVVACSSLPSLSFVDDDAGGGGGGEGGSEDPRPDTAGCVKTGAEICDDGLDNDCNGTADCADPACGTHACVTAAPAGWDLVAFAESAPPACPSSYASSDLKILSGSATVTCPCSCAGSGGSGATCAGATTAITAGDDVACNAGQVSTTLNSNTGVVCVATPVDLSLGGPGSTGFAKLTPPMGPATCTPTGSTTKTNTTDGRACAAPTTAAAGCDASSRCLPKAPGFTMCISKAGPQTCPAGFAKTRRAGTTASDTRACTTCTCNPPAPCATSVTLFANANCTGKKASFAGSACAAPLAGADTNVTAKGYTSTVTGGCSVGTPSTALGELTFGGERTICCK